jgi:hypothetical protein
MTSIRGVVSVGSMFNIYIYIMHAHAHAHVHLHIESCFQDGDGNLDIQEYQVFTNASKSISKSKTVFGS